MVEPRGTNCPWTSRMTSPIASPQTVGPLTRCDAPEASGGRAFWLPCGSPPRWPRRCTVREPDERGRDARPCGDWSAYREYVDERRHQYWGRPICKVNLTNALAPTPVRLGLRGARPVARAAPPGRPTSPYRPPRPAAQAVTFLTFARASPRHACRGRAGPSLTAEVRETRYSVTRVRTASRLNASRRLC